jgi:hypothetical protein
MNADSALQTLEVYKTLIPDINGYLIGHLSSADLNALRATYNV